MLALPAFLAPSPAAAADDAALVRLRDQAQARIAAADYPGALTLLQNVSPDLGPGRLLFGPTNENCLVLPDPSGRAAFFCVGASWAGCFDPDAPSNGFTRLVPFPNSLQRNLQDFGSNLRPYAAVLCNNRLVAAFDRYSTSGGRPSGLLVCLFTNTLKVDWVYDHEDDYTTWTVGQRALAFVGGGISRAIIGLNVTNGAVAWENSELRTTWTELASCPHVIAAGNREMLAALDEESGSLLWTTNAPVTHLLADGDRLLVSSATEGVSAFQARSGKRLWTQPADPAGTAPVLALQDDTVLAVSGNRIRRLDAATGAIRSVLLIPGMAEVEAAVSSRKHTYLRTDAGHVCLDNKGLIVFQRASAEGRGWRARDARRQDLWLWQDRILLDNSAGRGLLLNVADPVTGDDLLEMRVACEAIVREEKTPGTAMPKVRELKRGLGSLLPAVLRAQAHADPARLHALYLANMDLALPDARLEMLTELRQNAGLLWCRARSAYATAQPNHDVALIRTFRDEFVICDWRSGREIRAMPDQSETSFPVLARLRNHAVFLNDEPHIVTCLDLRTGRLRWRKDIEVLPRPPDAAAGESSFSETEDPFNGTYNPEAIILEGGPDNRRIGLRADNGELLWNQAMDYFEPQYEMPHWRLTRAQGTYLTSHSRQRMFWHSSQIMLQGIDVPTGREQWTRRLPEQTHILGWSVRHLAMVTQIDKAPKGMQSRIAISDLHTGKNLWTQTTNAWTTSFQDDCLILTGPEAEQAYVRILAFPSGQPILSVSLPSNEVWNSSICIAEDMVFLVPYKQMGNANDHLREGSPALVLALPTGRVLGRMMIPPYIIDVHDGVLVGSGLYSHYTWAFDWKLLRQQLAATTPQAAASAATPLQAPTPATPDPEDEKKAMESP